MASEEGNPQEEELAALPAIGADQPEALRYQFLLLALHDLRTPLTTMRLAVDTWRKDSQAGREAHLFDLLGRTWAKVEFHVEELGWIYRLKSDAFSALRRRPIDLNRLVQETAAEYLIRGLAIGITLEYDLASVPQIGGDAAFLRHLIVLMLGHTLLRLETGQRVRVKTESAEGGAALSISDNGSLPALPLRDILAGLRQGVVSPLTRAALYAAFCLAQAHGGVLGADANESGNIIRLWLPPI